jgi:CRISPR type III-A-associated RAMP protein Csm4
MPSSTQPALLIKLRPTGPWRIGPDSGARDRVDRVYHSDTLYSAVTAAMAQLELRDKWLAATAAAEGGPAVRFTSCFPFQGDTLFVPPPRHMWPPAAATRLRFKSTRFVPVEMVRALVDEKPLAEDRWIIDPASECLLRADRASQGGPFRIAIRTSASVDRLNHGAVEVHSVAVLEFGERAGLWTLAVFRDEKARAEWKSSIQAAFRLLADSGFGGERSNGFGHSQTPIFQDCRLPDLILRPPATIKAIATSRTPLTHARLTADVPEAPPEPAPEPTAESSPETVPDIVVESVSESEAVAPDIEVAAPVEEVAAPEPETPAVEQAPAAAPESAWWLLSLFSPGAEDEIDWQGGSYSVVTRGGRIESRERWGDKKRLVRMISEGSVLRSPAAPNGAAPNVAPDDFPHPVFRSGHAVSIAIPWRVNL